jgi:hypothetical protein
LTASAASRTPVSSARSASRPLWRGLGDLADGGQLAAQRLGALVGGFSEPLDPAC